MLILWGCGAGSSPIQNEPAALPALHLLCLLYKMMNCYFFPLLRSYCIKTGGRKDLSFVLKQGEAGAQGPPGFPGKAGPKVRAFGCL